MFNAMDYQLAAERRSRMMQQAERSLQAQAARENVMRVSVFTNVLALALRMRSPQQYMKPTTPRHIKRRALV